MVVETLQVPPTEAGSKERAPGGTAGGMDAGTRTKERRMGKAGT